MPILSLDHLTLFELTPPQLVDTAGRAGFTHVGLRLNPAAPGEHQHPMIGDTPMRRETIAALRDRGVAVLDFGVLRLKPETVIEAFEPVLEAGATLGARNVVVNGDEPDPARLADLLARLCELGARYDLCMNLEFTPWTGLNSLASAIAVVQASGRPEARVMVDTIHVDRSLGTPADIAAVPRSLINYAQLCDGHGPRPADFDTMIYQARNERGFPGEGNIDLAGMLRALPRGIPLSIEAPTAELARTLSPLERAARALASTRALLERAYG